MRTGRVSDLGPAEYADILSDDASGTLPLVVGGQAVNLWALIFEQQEPELSAHEPFTSIDCDVVANQNWVLTIAAKHHLKYKTFRAGSASPAVGIIFIPLASGDTELQVLRNIRGLSQKQMEASAIEILLNERRFRVINPISLLKAKLANVIELDQEGRQDVRHVRILTHCVCGFLKGQIEDWRRNAINTKDCVTICDFAAQVISSTQAVTVAKMYGVDFSAVLPKRKLKDASEAKFDNFLSKRLPSLGLG